MEKMTKRQKFEMLKEIVADNENAEMLIAFLDREIELVSKKRTSKTLTKTQKENIGVKETLMTVLAEATEPMRNGDIAAKAGVSPQKSSALLKQLKDAGEVVRTETGGVAYFSVVNAE